MSLIVLVVLAWASWVIVFGALFLSTSMSAQDTRRTPELGQRFDHLVFALLYALMIGAGWLLHCFTQSQSRGGALTMAIVLGIAVIKLFAQPGKVAPEHTR